MVEPITADVKRFHSLHKVLVGRTETQAVNHVIENAAPHRQRIRIKFQGVNDRHAARELVGSYLYISRENALGLPPNTFFVHDVIGLNVKDEQGKPLGRVVDVLKVHLVHLKGYGNDLYVIRGDTKEFMIPAVKEFVRQIDLEKKTMVIRVIDGLLEV